MQRHWRTWEHFEMPIEDKMLVKMIVYNHFLINAPSPLLRRFHRTPLFSHTACKDTYMRNTYLCGYRKYQLDYDNIRIYLEVDRLVALLSPEAGKKMAYFLYYENLIINSIILDRMNHGNINDYGHD